MPLIRLLCLTLLLSLSSLALTSAADDDGTWTYSLSGDEAIVTGCVASCPEDLVIPAIINGYNVVHIGRSAFFEYRLTSVIIPNGVRSIGYEAFANNQLTSVRQQKHILSHIFPTPPKASPQTNREQSPAAPVVTSMTFPSIDKHGFLQRLIQYYMKADA